MNNKTYYTILSIILASFLLGGFGGFKVRQEQDLQPLRDECNARIGECYSELIKRASCEPKFIIVEGGNFSAIKNVD